LKSALKDHRFNDFRLIVAYAKSGPLLRLEDLLGKWRASGKTARAILGIDQLGTSCEALELALELFDKVYVTQESGLTFHPKIYVFRGPKHADAFVGSNNLTVGGTEKNFEAAIHLELDLPNDSTTLNTLLDCWREPLPKHCPSTRKLDEKELRRLVAHGLVISERAMRLRKIKDDDAAVGRGSKGSGPGLQVKPESPLPKKAVARATPHTIAATKGPMVKAARGFAIQIKPHHNGEIFLSVSAALQNPAFFGWPFKGKTIPKKAGNPAYPQRSPDPIVNISVFASNYALILMLAKYALNTVYYATKSEIRITAAPLVGIVPDYSVMIMEPGDDDIDYEITIHAPQSPEYPKWMQACNQQMPGGGQSPRKFGWF